MNRCRSCGAEFPSEWIKHGANGACCIGGEAFCSDGCYNRWLNETVRTQSHIPTNHAKKVPRKIIVKFARQAMFNISKFRQLDGEFLPPAAADLADERE